MARNKNGGKCFIAKSSDGQATSVEVSSICDADAAFRLEEAFGPRGSWPFDVAKVGRGRVFSI
jgi:hypothetical protein